MMVKSSVVVIVLLGVVVECVMPLSVDVTALPFLPTPAPEAGESTPSTNKQIPNSVNAIVNVVGKHTGVFLPTVEPKTMSALMETLQAPSGPGVGPTTSPMSPIADPRTEVSSPVIEQMSPTTLSWPATQATARKPPGKESVPEVTSPQTSSDDAVDTPREPSTASPTQGEPRMPAPPVPREQGGALEDAEAAERLDVLLEVWDPHSVRVRWADWLRELRDPSWRGMGASPDHPTWKHCSDHVAAYLEDLRVGKGWAVMLSDASGRAPRGLFDGNGYWLGSRALCGDLDPGAAAGLPAGSPPRSWYRYSHPARSPFHRNDVDPTKAPDGEAAGTAVAPFPLSFFVAKLAVNVVTKDLTLSQSASLGLCLPASCSTRDVTRLVKAAIRRPNAVRLLRVRKLDESYDFLQDTAFHILVGFGGLALLLMVVGTTYDVVLEHRAPRGDPVASAPGECEPASAAARARAKTPQVPPAKPPRLARGSDVILRLHGSPDVAADLDLKGPRPSCGPGDVSNTDDFHKVEKSVQECSRSGNPAAAAAEKVPAEAAQVKDQDALWRVVLLSFSARINLRKILTLRVGEDALGPVHGLRVISLLWVILAHVSLIIFHLADNKDFREKAEGDFLYQALSSGTFSVDTFFFLSGLLLCYLYFRSCGGRSLPGTLEGLKGRFLQFARMMVYRFIRLTPPYMFMLGVVQVSMKHFHSHAVAELPTRDYENCPKYWWRNLLYINTFFSNSERCMTWSWYLADDTQFYAIGIVLLIIAVSYFWVAVGAIVMFICSSWATTAAVAYSAHHVTNVREPFAHYDELYDKPWTRFGPFLIGICAGWLVWKTKCEITLHPVVVAVGWLMSGATMIGCVFGLYGVNLSPASSAAYVALSHTAWAVAVAWVLVACLSGHGGWAARLLSWRGMFPASRLCYCAYLLHPQLMRSMALHADSAFHISRDHVAVLFVGFSVASFSLALLLSLALEAPVVSLLSALRPRLQLQLHQEVEVPDDGLGPRRSRKLPVPHMPDSWKTAGFGY